jgi:alcohol dehydrogenase (NADP+)
MPLSGYLSMLKVGGKFVMVGAPEDPLPRMPAHIFIMNNVSLGGSAIGSPKDIEEMLELAATQHVPAWIQTRPMNETNAAVIDMEKGLARYRYCLVNEENISELSN